MTVACIVLAQMDNMHPLRPIVKTKVGVATTTEAQDHLLDVTAIAFWYEASQNCGNRGQRVFEPRRKGSEQHAPRSQGR